MSTITFSDWFDIFYSTSASVYDMCELSDGRYLYSFCDAADDDKIKAVVLKKIGDEIFSGAVETITTTASKSPSCCKFSNNETKPRALIVWVEDVAGASDDDCKAMWVEVNTDDSITTKTETMIKEAAAGEDCETATCCMLDENRAAIFYVYDDGDDNDLYGISVDANGNTLTPGVANYQNGKVNASYHYFQAFQVDRDLAVCMHREGDSYAQIAVFSDDTIIRDSAYKCFDTGYYPRGCALTYNKILVAGTDDTDNNYPKAKVCDMSSSWSYGANEMTDGDMEAADVANWTPTNATLSSEAGGQSGNCMKLLENGGANPTAHWDWVASATTVFEVEFYVKAGDEASYDVEIYDVNTAATICKIKENEATTTWERQRFFFKSIDDVNSTRIILRQKCANGAGTYILFDSVVIRPITSISLSFGSAYTIESVSSGYSYVRNVHMMDATHAMVCLGDSVAALTISGTTVTGITPVDVPGISPSTYNFESSFIEVSADNTYKSIISYWDGSLDIIRAALMQWQSIPTATGYCGVAGVTEKLRLVSTADAEYSSLRIRNDGATHAADLVTADPVFNNYAVRIQHPIHGILAWRDASAE